MVIRTRPGLGLVGRVPAAALLELRVQEERPPVVENLEALAWREASTASRTRTIGSGGSRPRTSSRTGTSGAGGAASAAPPAVT